MTYCMCRGSMNDGYIFKLMLLARVNLPPHKSYIIVAT